LLSMCRIGRDPMHRGDARTAARELPAVMPGAMSAMMNAPLSAPVHGRVSRALSPRDRTWCHRPLGAVPTRFPRCSHPVQTVVLTRSHKVATRWELRWNFVGAGLSLPGTVKGRCLQQLFCSSRCFKIAPGPMSSRLLSGSTSGDDSIFVPTHLNTSQVLGAVARWSWDDLGCGCDAVPSLSQGAKILSMA
jgi:hypothetical protein